MSNKLENTDNIKDQLAREEAIKEYESLMKEGSTTGASSKAVEEEKVSINNENQETIEETEPKREYTALELSQMEEGWDPNKENGVDAAEFKRVGEIIASKRAASKEARDLKFKLDTQDRILKQILEDNKKIAQRDLEDRNRNLETKKIEKIQEGDVQAVLAIDLEQKALYTPKQEEVKQPMESAAVIAFKEESKEWLNGTSDTDIAMQGYLKMRIEKYMQTDPDVDEKLAIASIKEGLVKTFPHKFHNPNKNKPGMVASSTTPGTSKGNYTLSRLDSYQLKEYDMIKRADNNFTVEDYIKRLEVVGRLK